MAAVPANCLGDVRPLALQACVIGIDEGQFFPDTVEFCEEMANLGKTVIVAALDGTFQRKVSICLSPQGHTESPSVGLDTTKCNVQHKTHICQPVQCALLSSLMLLYLRPFCGADCFPAVLCILVGIW